MIQGIIGIILALIWFGYIMKIPRHDNNRDSIDKKYLSDKAIKFSEKLKEIRGSIAAVIVLVYGLIQIYNALAIKYGWILLF